MNTIILIILFAVAASVFQAIGQNAGRNKKKMTYNQAKKFTFNPEGIDMNENRDFLPMQEPFIYKQDMNFETEAPMERVITEAPEKAAVQVPEEKATEAEGSVLFDLSSYDELQKSIIMAEILGKPKSLQKA